MHRVAPSEKSDETRHFINMAPFWKDFVSHRLEEDISYGGDANTLFDDPHNATRRFDLETAHRTACV